MQGVSVLAAAFAVLSVCNAALSDLTLLEALGRVRGPTIEKMVKATNLTTLLSDPNANITFFGPNENRIAGDLRNLGLTLDQLLADTNTLYTVLTNHAIAGQHMTSDFVNERVFNTLGGKKIRVNHYLFNNRYYVDGSNIVARNIQTKNGVLQGIDHILSPLVVDAYDYISQASDLTTLKQAVDAVGLQMFLIDQNPITIFAPTDTAFGEIGPLVTTLLGKPDLLAEILKYHVIPGSLYRGGFHQTTLHTFEETDRLTITNRGIDGSRFTQMDISVTNGVIHKIDKVLIPASLQGQI